MGRRRRLAAPGLVTPLPLGAQAPRSEHATVTQVVGPSEVTIVYNRPGARGGTLLGRGGVVPWGKVWCPGADTATTIALSRDMVVGGQPLAAGKYSIWAIPGSDEWTLIFSRAADVFHIPYPGESQDALRLKVKPQAGGGPFMESLAFYFPAADRDRALLNLHWGDTIVQVVLSPQAPSR